MTSLLTSADAALPVRYSDAALTVLDAEDRRRLLDQDGSPRCPDELPWELLYRIEPELYARLVAGERLHQGILEWLPESLGHVLEVGAGAGRLTLDLASRCARLVAVEPAAGLRAILGRRLRDLATDNVRVVPGFFDALPDGQRGFDLVVTCSAFTVGALADPDGCLASMESRCAPGGMVVVIWPGDVSWLQARGYKHIEFEGPMLIEYGSVDEAVALARIFYPAAARSVSELGSRFVDFATLGIPPPRGLCCKRS